MTMETSMKMTWHLNRVVMANNTANNMEDKAMATTEEDTIAAHVDADATMTMITATNNMDVNNSIK